MLVTGGAAPGTNNGFVRTGMILQAIMHKIYASLWEAVHITITVRNKSVMNKNALLFDRLTTDEMNILLSELNGKFPNLGVVTKHQNDWNASFQEAMEYLDSIDEGYDPSGYLRRNWPSSPADGEQIDFFGRNNNYFDVTVNFNSSFLWLISFWYEWSIDFMAFSDINCAEDVVEKLHKLAVDVLDDSYELKRPYASNSLFGPFDDMDAISRELDFYLVGNMGGDEPFHPIFFCKQGEFVEYLKSHPAFKGRCDYFNLEEYIKDPVLNPLRLQLPPGM